MSVASMLTRMIASMLLSRSLFVHAARFGLRGAKSNLEPHRENNLYSLFTIVPEAQCTHTHCTNDILNRLTSVAQGDRNASGVFPMHVSAGDFKEQEGDRFSMMKYGHNDYLDFYAGLMASLIIEKFPSLKTEPEGFALVRPASMYLPTAATILESKILNLLNKDCNGTLHDLAMVRSGHSKVDFAKLKTKEERDKALDGLFTLEGPAPSGKKIIFIEDTVVSGSHYIQTQNVLLQKGVQLSDINCFVIGSLQGVPPQVEGELNEVHFNPNSPAISNRLLESYRQLAPGSSPTSRQVKFTLGQLEEGPWSKFEDALAWSQHVETRRSKSKIRAKMLIAPRSNISIMPLPLWLASGAVEDGLHKKYPRRFCQLVDIITRRPAEAFRNQTEQIKNACKEVNQTEMIKYPHEDLRDSWFGDWSGYTHNVFQRVCFRITRTTHSVYDKLLSGMNF